MDSELYKRLLQKTKGKRPFEPIPDYEKNWD